MSVALFQCVVLIIGMSLLNEIQERLLDSSDFGLALVTRHLGYIGAGASSLLGWDFEL